MKTALITIIIATAALVACQRELTPATKSTLLPSSEDSSGLDPKVVSSIEKYVSDSRHWNRSDYFIQKEQPKDGYDWYYIGYKVAPTTPKPGRVPSFIVIFDRDKLVVVRELWFQ